MPSRVRKFVCREFTNTVDLDLFRKFLRQFPGDGRIDWDQLPEDDREKREALFQIFQRAEDLPVELQNALHCAKILAGDAGVSRLVELAEAYDLILVPSQDGRERADRVDNRSLVLLAFIHHRKLFDRAVDLTRIWSVTRPLERIAARNGVLTRHEDLLFREDFRKAVSTYFQRKYCGQYCDVRWYPDGEDINILVLHGKNTRTANVEEEGEERALPFREIAEDTIRYSPASGWLKVGAPSVRDARKLVELFAEHLIGDKNFFSDPLSDEIYTLEPINEAGPDFQFRYGWDHRVTNVVVREVLLDDGGLIGKRRRSPWNDRVRDDQNALARMAWLGIDARNRQLDIAAVKLDFHLRDGDRDSVVRVNLEPPNTASFQDHSYEDVIFSHLERNGLRRGPRPDPTALAAE